MGALSATRHVPMNIVEKPASRKKKTHSSSTSSSTSSSSSLVNNQGEKPKRKKQVPKYVDVDAAGVPGASSVIAQHADILLPVVRKIPFADDRGDLEYYSAIKTADGKYYCLLSTCGATISPNNLKKHMAVHMRDAHGTARPPTPSAFSPH